MTPLERFTRALEDHGCVPRETGGGEWEARCPVPAHDDSSPSLGYRSEGNGQLLVICRAGCRNDDVVAAVGLAMADLFPPKPPKKKNRTLDEIVTSYPYVDEAGVELFRCVRFAAPKEFKQWQLRANGTWIKNIKGVRRVLYRLPDVIAGVARGERIWIPEGEKDVDRLVAEGCVATCNPMGRGKWLDEYSAYLAGADVTISIDLDADGGGLESALEIARSLRAHNATVTIVQPMTGKDVSDHLDAGRRLNDLLPVDEAVLEAAGDAGGISELPMIVATGRDLDAITNDALAAVVAANDPPQLFAAHGALARVIDDGESERIELLTLPGLRGHLARVARWRARLRNDDLKPCAPPEVVVTDIASLPGWPELPTLRGISACPVLGPDGVIRPGPGYEPTVGLWVADVPGLAVPVRPTKAQVDAAVEFLLEQLLFDFQFAGQPDLANTIAMMVLPFIRSAIEGLTPMHLIDAPTEGTGKGLLVQVVFTVSLGHAPSLVAMGRDDDETRKRLTAQLAAGPPVIVFDNVSGKVDSSALAMALTAPIWEDRQLGSTKILRIPVRNVWVATANNVTLSGEIARRCVRIRLDTGLEAPYERTGFRHPRLALWAFEHRRQLMQACLTLVAAWLAEGMPKGTAVMGSYEPWAETMSGLLDVVGIPGFLDNARDLRSAAVNETAAWYELCELWWAKHQSNPVKASELWSLAEDIDGLGITASTPLAAKTSFGMKLGAQRDRRVGPWIICKVGTLHRAGLWRLQDVAPISVNLPPAKVHTDGNALAPDAAGEASDVNLSSPRQQRFTGGSER